jgi:malate synthase
LGTNVGRWDYLGSLIEMWKDDPQGVYPDPQSIGMASPNMIAYQRYNALMMLMAGMKNGELENAGPIGGMAAVMIYQAGDPYGRSRYNPLALRAMVIDKLRERVLGLIFVTDKPLSADQQPTLEDILAKRVEGRLYDCYRQSWVASPEPDYVAAGNAPLRAQVEQLQAILDAP